MDTNSDQEDDDLNQSAHKAAYIFVPNNSKTGTDERPSKRRKIIKSTGSTNNTTPQFVPLLDGKEPADLVNLRLETFRSFWSECEERIQALLQEADTAILSEITNFVQKPLSEVENGKIPAGFVIAGPNIGSHTRLFDQLSRTLESGKGDRLVILESSDTTNLKAALKTIIRSATKSEGGNDTEEGTFGLRKGLPYDLQLLHDYMQDTGMEQLTIAFRDSEAFDTAVLADLLLILSSWSNRVSIVLLFGIATSVDLFEDRLSKSAIRALQGQIFDIRGTENTLERILQLTLSQGQMWLGSKFCRMLIDRARDHIVSPEDFVAALKYAYMSHFFANPLTVLLSDNSRTNKPHTELCEAIRRLPSFRTFVEHQLDNGNAKLVRSLLNSDASLLRETKVQLNLAQKSMNQTLDVVSLIHKIIALLKPSSTCTWSDIYITAVSGTLPDSPTVRDILLSIRRAPPSVFKQLIQLLTTCLWVSDNIETWFDDLIASEIATSAPNNARLDREISTSLTLLLASHFKETIPSSSITQLFPSEIFLLTLPSPTNLVFTPKPRAAIERALARPYEYLGCECCGPSTMARADRKGARSTNQPSTAILWQLLQEGGAVLNVGDLWGAFGEIMRGNAVEGGGKDDADEGDDGGGDEDAETEKRLMTLFYRGLAELKYLGWIKRGGGRGRGDCVIKGAWGRL